MRTREASKCGNVGKVSPDQIETIIKWRFRRLRAAATTMAKEYRQACCLTAAAHDRTVVLRLEKATHSRVPPYSRSECQHVKQGPKPHSLVMFQGSMVSTIGNIRAGDVVSWNRERIKEMKGR